MQRIGGRKFVLGLAYLFVVSSMAVVAMVTGKADLYGVSALAVSLSTGLGVVVWGNVQAARTAQASEGRRE